MTGAARRAHYRRFYETDPPSDTELLLVIGNCQAESVRLLLDPDGQRSIRVPPVFELDADEVGLLEALLPRVTTLASQPVRDDYRGLPLGTRQLASRLVPRSRMVTFPVVRYAGLHPFHVVVHSARTESGDPRPLAQPPVVPYHDLRVVAAAVGRPGRRPIGPDAVRTVASWSLAELRRREQLIDVSVAAVLEHPGPEHMRTVNHPGNPVLMALATGVAEAAGLDRPRDPGRALLDAVRAPVEPVVAAAWDLPASSCSSDWRIDGARVPAEQVAARHQAWYAEHPDVAAAVWERHEATAGLLGLG